METMHYSLGLKCPPKTHVLENQSQPVALGGGETFKKWDLVESFRSMGVWPQKGPGDPCLFLFLAMR
jgi:hypothetical protein